MAAGKVIIAPNPKNPDISIAKEIGTFKAIKNSNNTIPKRPMTSGFNFIFPPNTFK